MPGSGWLGFGGVESACFVFRVSSVCRGRRWLFRFGGAFGSFRAGVAASVAFVGGMRGAGSVLASSAWSAPGNSPALASVTTLLRGTSGVQPRDSEQ